MSDQNIITTEQPKVQQLINKFTSISIHCQEDDNIADKNQIVVYTTSIGIVRSTAQDCQFVCRIFQNLSLKYIEKDVSIHPLYLRELYERIGRIKAKLPQTFIGDLYIGEASAVESLNESGKLREMTANFERQIATQVSCTSCYDRRFIPCQSCHGSRRNRSGSFNQIVRLKCGQCNENGLQECPSCCITSRPRSNSAPKCGIEKQHIYTLHLPQDTSRLYVTN